MFQTTLNQYESKLNLNTTNSMSYKSITSTSDIDLQYEIYSQYIHLFKQQIAIQQLVLMKDSQILLESINLTGKADTSRDAHSTMDSLCYDQDFQHTLINQFSVIEKRSPRKIIRKRTQQSILNPLGRPADDFTQILNQIQKNCTQNTFSAIKTILQEHKKNMTKIVDVQKKQKNARRLQEKTQKLQQQNAILRVKLTEIQQKIKSKDQQIKSLKDKLNQLKTIDKQNIRIQKNHIFSGSKSPHQDSQLYFTSQTPNSNIKNYLQQKQSYLKQRMNRIQQIQTKIQHLIENSVIYSKSIDKRDTNDTACSKCCHMIKKIKDSVMKYRLYLEQEAEQCEKLYNMLKNQLENCLTDTVIQVFNK